jgi:hypothetical protein
MRDEDDVRRLLGRAGADEGPPLRIDAATVLRQGRRIRTRRRGLVVAGSSLAAVAAMLVAALLLGHPASEPRIQPANRNTPPITTPVPTVTVTQVPPVTTDHRSLIPTGTGTPPTSGPTDGTTTYGPTSGTSLATTNMNTTTQH